MITILRNIMTVAVALTGTALVVGYGYLTLAEVMR